MKKANKTYCELFIQNGCKELNVAHCNRNSGAKIFEFGGIFYWFEFGGYESTDLQELINEERIVYSRMGWN